MFLLIIRYCILFCFKRLLIRLLVVFLFNSAIVLGKCELLENELFPQLLKMAFAFPVFRCSNSQAHSNAARLLMQMLLANCWSFIITQFQNQFKIHKPSGYRAVTKDRPNTHCPRPTFHISQSTIHHPHSDFHFVK